MPELTTPSKSDCMDTSVTTKYVEENYEKYFIEPLKEFIRIPNLTPMVDSEFLTNGLLEKAVNHIDTYIKSLQLKGLSSKRYDKGGNAPPLLVYMIEPYNCNSDKNVMIYAHLDKQPYGPGWDTEPTEPVIKDDKLYGRGGVDDGYAPFASMFAIKTIQAQGKSHPRIVLTIESEEESGSVHLLDLLEAAKDDIKVPDVLFCLDGGCYTYDRLWLCNSLRGSMILDVTIEMAEIGYHSGVVGGIIPETARIARILMDRVDDVNTGEIKAKFMGCDAPPAKKEEALRCAALTEDDAYDCYQLKKGGKFMHHGDKAKMYLASTWEPTLAVTGADGFPPIVEAGNVIRPMTAYRFMSRLSPNASAPEAADKLIKLLEENPPYGAHITAKKLYSGQGFYQESLSQVVTEALNESTQFFGTEWGQFGIGGTIPFIAELKKKFTETQVLCMGAMGNDSNAHGPNEFIRIDYAKKLIMSWAHMIQKIA